MNKREQPGDSSDEMCAVHRLSRRIRLSKSELAVFPYTSYICMAVCIRLSISHGILGRAGGVKS